MTGSGFRGPDREISVSQPLQPFDVMFRFPKLRFDSLVSQRQRPSVRSGDRTVPASIEQLYAHGMLEEPDALRECRLRDVERGGGPHERALFDHSAQVPELFRIRHHWPLPKITYLRAMEMRNYNNLS